MNLYIVRHGITDSNINNVFNGHYDEDLNEIGVNQIKDLINDIETLKLDLIISSPLLRAKHTAEILANDKLPIIVDSRLIERNMGELTQKTKIIVDKSLWNYYEDLKYKDLETFEDICLRINSFLEEILKKYKGKNILLVTHAFITRAINIYFNDIPQDGDLRKYGLKNGEIKKYKI